MHVYIYLSVYVYEYVCQHVASYCFMFHMMPCFSEPDVVSNLMSNGSDEDQINITWNQPSIPNGIIIMYDIRYRETDSNDSFIYVNGTTNTQHTIDGLTSFTNYTIGVRAHTIAGPGEWIDIKASTLLPGIFI